MEQLSKIGFAAAHRKYSDSEMFIELCRYQDTGLTPEECAELAKAKAEGRILPEGFGYVQLSDKTHVVFKPKMASFRVEMMNYYSASTSEEAEAALAAKEGSAEI